MAANRPRRYARPPRPVPQLREGTRPDGSRYIPVTIWPRTLADLRLLGRDFGEAAVAEARWGAIGVWFLNGEEVLRNPSAVAFEAMRLMHGRDRHYMGWPRHDGLPWPMPALDGLSLESRQEAERVAAETLADWQAAGEPYLTPWRIKQTYQFLINSPAFRAKYVVPAQPEAA